MASVGLAAPAQAQPGSANARGVVVDLSAEVLDVAVISAGAVIGTATAPAGGGTDTSTLLAISVPGAVGVSASGTVAEVTATRAPGVSSALSRVNGLSLDVLGVDVLDAAEASASVSCPLVGPQTADTTLVDLELFGSAVTLVANGPAVNASAAVTVAGLAGATLNASLTRTEVTTALGATAAAVRATLTLSGTILGEPVTIPVGTVIVAEATCERPSIPAPPTAATIVPDEGPQSGGQTVTITGSGFVPGGTTVTFDGAPATNVVVAPNGTSLTAVTPPGAVGPASVAVTTPGGTAAPLAYTYLADGSDAVITNLTPTTGPTSGGTTVTITGTGFTGATQVTFDGVPGTNFTVNPAGTTITVVTPPNTAGPATVELVFPAGDVTAPTFTYIAPTITSVVPDEGPTTGGTTVTITGTGLGAATGVNFGDTPGTNVVVDPSGTSLTVVTPPGAPGTVDVTVLIPGANATAPDAFTYQAAPPSSATITPDEGPQSGGQTVTITGSGFVPGGTTVTFDGAPATNVVVAPNGTSLTAVTPPGAVGPASVAVTTPGGTAAPLAYTYLADGSDAVITNLTPTTGPTSGGTTVTITGTGFTGATQVTFDGVPGTNFTVNPAGTTITVVTPPNTAGPATVELVFPAGEITAPTFTYEAVPPALDTLSPGQGPTAGGTTVTVGGSGFVPGQTTVSICGRTIPANEVTVAADGRSLSFRTPACRAGDTTVTVTTAGGVSNGLTFRYVGQILPVTGDSLGTPLTFGAMLTVLGAFLVLFSRRRKHNSALK
ncbi:LPXTG cell wall anchor domain-containing protein [Micromonospora sp. CV4]|nr:LPXTG cell wall anchor domain-containing protein [Micromonospora sp. CV4]